MSHLGTSNRLYRLLVGNARGGWSIFGWGTAASSIAYATLFFFPGREVFAGVWAVGLAGCAAAFLAAARLTDGTVRSSSYQYLRLTGLPASEIVRGFVLVVVHRLRFGLGFLTGLAPLFVLSAYLYMFQGARQHCFAYISRQNWAVVVRQSGFTRVFRLQEPMQCIASGDARLAGSALANIPVPLGLICLLLLAIALGVAWGLAHNQPSFWPRMGLLVAAGVAGLSAAGARLLKPVLEAPVCWLIHCTYILPWPPDLPLETILLFVFLLAAVGVGRLAQRWV